MKHSYANGQRGPLHHVQVVGLACTVWALPACEQVQREVPAQHSVASAAKNQPDRELAPADSSAVVSPNEESSGQPQRPLDLTYRGSEQAPRGEDDELIDESQFKKTLLKDLFTQEKAPKTVSVGGRIIRSGSKTDLRDVASLMDSVKGAEVSIELKTR